MTKYNFDHIIDRSGTNSMSVKGYKDYLFGEYPDLKLPFKEDELISMWIADMSFATCPTIIEAVKNRLDHGIFGYSQVFDPNYNNSFQEWSQSRYNWLCKAEHIVYSPGVVPALFDLIKQLCRKGDKILMTTPSYGFFKYAADHHGIEIVTTDLIKEGNNFMLDFDDIAQKVKDPRVNLSIFCSPHNPTGRLWSAEELIQFGQLCLDNNITIISDEIHCDLLREGKTFVPLAKLFPNSDQIITCMSPSKTFNLAGFMLANIIIPNDDMRSQWQKEHLPVYNPLSIVANQAAYVTGHTWLEELTEYLDENFSVLDRFLKAKLPKAKFQIPDATYLAWVDMGAYFPEEIDLSLFFAQKAGVLLEGGHMFVANGKGYIRLNLACPRERLEEALHRIAKVIGRIS